MNYPQQQVAHAFAHCDVLIEAIKSKKMSEGRFDGIMDSYLTQPAYIDRRRELFEMCMQRKDDAMGGPQLKREMPELYESMKQLERYRS